MNQKNDGSATSPEALTDKLIEKIAAIAANEKASASGQRKEYEDVLRRTFKGLKKYHRDLVVKAFKGNKAYDQKDATNFVAYLAEEAEEKAAAAAAKKAASTKKAAIAQRKKAASATAGDVGATPKPDAATGYILFEDVPEGVATMNKVLGALRMGDDQRYILSDAGSDAELQFVKKSVVTSTFKPWKLVRYNSEGKPSYTPMLPLWEELMLRRDYKRVVFRPDLPRLGEGDPAVFNLWTGWRVEEKEGDWSLLRQHMFEILCDGNAENFNYLLAWFADLFQHPEVKPGVAVVLYGDQGSGKSILSEQVLSKILGPHLTVVATKDAIGGKFNAHTDRTLVLHSEEALWGGDRKSIGAFKHALTGLTKKLERKGVDAFFIDLFERYLICSNEDRPFPGEGPNERRGAVFKVSDKRIGDKAYFDALIAEINNGGAEAFFYAMLHHDYSDINIRWPPRTEGLSAVIEFEPSSRTGLVVRCA